MAERAHPDDPDFQVKREIVWLKGIVPWLRIERNPYRDAFFWRYGMVAKVCKNKDVLDIPCGMGWGTSLLKECNALVGVDISNEAIQEAHRKYRASCKFLVGDMEKLVFKDRSFDIVACLEGIEHVPPQVGRAFISESARVLRPGGTLFLSSPHSRTKEHSGNPHHVKEYSPDELLALIEPYYDIADVIARDVDDLMVYYFRARRRE